MKALKGEPVVGRAGLFDSRDGRPNIQYVAKYDYIVSGSFQPGNKALLQCKDVNIATISQSVYALATTAGNIAFSFPNATRATQLTPTGSAASTSDRSNTVAILGEVVAVIIVLTILGAVVKTKKYYVVK